MGLRNYIVSSIKYKAVLMTEMQTANENVRQCLEYLCEKLNNVGTKLQRTLYTTLSLFSTLIMFTCYSLQVSNFVHSMFSIHRIFFKYGYCNMVFIHKAVLLFCC